MNNEINSGRDFAIIILLIIVAGIGILLPIMPETRCIQFLGTGGCETHYTSILDLLLRQYNR